MPTEFGSERWNEGLKLVSFCPICDSRYTLTEARILGTQGETRLMHVQCRKCRNAILSLVLVNNLGASSVGLLTDLSYDDVVRVNAAEMITVDDVMAVHETLRAPQWRQAFMNHAHDSTPRIRKSRLQRSPQNH